MPVVTLQRDEPIEKALKRLSKLVNKEGIIQAIKRHRFYEKPSEQKRKALSRSKKKIEKEKMIPFF
ncbi:MAG: 30S ribosomal protein S21 [Candidatus Aureabacteria bacterium]|nr:30S ribosomal protein S21 [Candidatus Auribacterota bacterium]